MASSAGLGDSSGGFASALGTVTNPMQVGGFGMPAGGLGMQHGASSCGEEGWFESSLSAAPQGQ